MDFDSILEKWENRRDSGKSSEAPPTEKAGSPSTLSSNWLDNYLPDSDTIASKDKDTRPPVSGGKSIWLRRSHQDVLDLHGMTGREAREEISRFMRSMRRRNLRKGLIVHGKGLHSADGSVLAPLVKEYLEMSAEISEFGRAARKDGGSGATWFILRQRSR